MTLVLIVMGALALCGIGALYCSSLITDDPAFHIAMKTVGIIALAQSFLTGAVVIIATLGN